MSAEATGLQIPVSFSLDEARAALKELESAARTAGKQIGDGLGGEGKKGVESLTNSFVAFKREQVQQGRLVGFYVREIAEFTGASKEAQGTIGGLGSIIAEAAAGGIGFGLALEAVKFGVEAIRREMEKAEAPAKALADLYEKQRVELEKANFMRKGGGEHEYEAVQASTGMEKKIADLQQRIRDIEAYKATPAGQQEYTYFKENAVQSPLDRAQEEMAGLQRYVDYVKDRASDLDNKVRGIEGYRGLGIEASSGLTTGEVTAWDAEAARLNKEQHQKLLEEERKYQADFLRAQQEFSVASWQATKGVSGEAGSTIRGQGSVFGLQDSRNPTPQAYADAQAMGRTSSGLQQVGGYGTNQGFQSSAYVEKLQENAQKEQAAIRKSQEVWQEYGRTVAGALSGVVSGQKSAGEAMRGIMQQMMQQLIQYAIQWILVKAGIIGADVETQWSDKGPYGWVIGLGQAAAAMAATLAFSNFGSAETGAALPSSGGPFPFLLHPNEWVLPAPITKGLTGLMEGGGPGGGTLNVTYNISAWDAQDASRALDRSHAALRDKFRQWQRDGRPV